MRIEYRASHRICSERWFRTAVERLRPRGLRLRAWKLQVLPHDSHNPYPLPEGETKGRPRTITIRLPRVGWDARQYIMGAGMEKYGYVPMKCRTQRQAVEAFLAHELYHALEVQHRVRGINGMANQTHRTAIAIERRADNYAIRASGAKAVV